VRSDPHLDRLSTSIRPFDGQPLRPGDRGAPVNAQHQDQTRRLANLQAHEVRLFDVTETEEWRTAPGDDDNYVYAIAL